MSDYAPRLGKASFECPHCGAVAHQTWIRVFAKFLSKEQAPSIPTEDSIGSMANNPKFDAEMKSHFLSWAHSMRNGKIFLEEGGEEYLKSAIENVWLSVCFSCDDLSVWVHDTLVFPAFMMEIRPNEDLTDEIKRDFIEAGKIAQTSPRGAAALLRLCVQKLCVQLGKPGKNINNDIAALVEDGLDVRIQRALDVVRVVGNNAVHPGEIDMQDDKTVASKLSRLINMIADKMITEPKQIDSLFGELPVEARKQIERRDRGNKSQ